MIFTGQVWNMVFSFYGSLRSVPAELKEVARIHRFGWFKTFRTVEVSVVGDRARVELDDVDGRAAGSS